MPRLLHYIMNSGPGQPGRNPKGTDPRAFLKKAVRPKLLVFDPSQDRRDFKDSGYDWDQIERAIATDSYATQAMLKYNELFWKEGYDLKGAVPESLVYIKQRMKVLGLAQGQSFDKLLQEISENMIRYHNCFIIKARSPEVAKLAGLSVKGLDGKDPVAGYFVAPVKTMTISYDEKGRVNAYKQEVQGSGKDPIVHKAEDVIHITYDRPSGQQWGIPFMDSAIEDIRAFRIIEEDMLNIVHGEIYPFIHYAVNGGKPEWPVDSEDIEAAYAEVEEMKGSGIIVTKGADTIKPIDKNNTGFDVNPYIQHFKERAVTSLGMAPHQLGLSSDVNKASAERLDSALFDKVKSYQSNLEDAVNDFVFFELLIEGGFDPLVAQKNGKSDPTVFFEFREVDVEAQIKRENHTSVLWLQNMITHDEMRERIGMIVDQDNFGLYHLDMVEIPMAEITKAMTGPDGGENPASPAKGTPQSKNNPANQKGNRGGPKISTSSWWDELEERIVELYRENDIDAISSLLDPTNTSSIKNPKLSNGLKLLIDNALEDSGEEEYNTVSKIRASFRTLDSLANR